MRSNTGKNIKLKTGKSNLDIVKSYVSGERAFVQVGYTDNIGLIDRKEGETWKDSQGNTWIKQDGVKKRLSNLGKINVEQKCSICNANIKFGNYLDQRVYARCGKCYDCSIIFDSRLKLLGKFNDYSKYYAFSTEYSKLKDLKTKILESMEYLENYDPELKYFNEDGTHEVWTDDTNTRIKVLDDLKKDIIEVERQISEYEKQLEKISYDSSFEEKAKEMTLEFIKNREEHKFDV